MQADEYDRNDNFRKRYEGEVDLFAREHVRKETNRERQRTREVTDQFDRQHEPGQPPEGPQKLLDVARAVNLYASVMVEQKRRNGQAERNHRTHGGRFQPWNQADQVHEQDKKEDRSEE